MVSRYADLPAHFKVLGALQLACMIYLGGSGMSSASPQVMKRLLVGCDYACGALLALQGRDSGCQSSL